MIARVRSVTAAATSSGSIVRSPSCTSTKTGVAPVWTITFAVAGHVIGVVITSSPGPTPSADESEVHRRGRRGQRDGVPRARVLGEAPLELASQRGRSSATPSGGWPRPRRPPPRRRRAAGSREKVLASTASGTWATSKRTRSIARPARSKATARDSARARTKPARSDATAQRPEDPARPPVDSRVEHALRVERLLETVRGDELAHGCDEEAHAGPACRRMWHRRLDRLAESARERETVQVDAERGEAELRVVTSAQPRRELDDPRPVRADHDLRVRRARSRSRALRPRAVPPRSRPRPRPRPATRARARRRRRGAGGKPVGDRERVESAVDRERVHRHLRARDELLDDQRAGCVRRASGGLDRAAASSAGSVDERESPLTLTIGRLDDAREAERLGRFRAGDRIVVPRLRHARARRSVRAGGPSRRRALPSRARSDAAGRADRRPGPRSRRASRSPARHDPVDPLGARQRSSPSSSSAETIARRSAYSNPGASGSRSQAITKSPRSRAARSRPSCAGPAPRTSRRRPSATGGVFSHQPRLSRYHATVRSSPSAKDVRARQPRSRSALSVEPMWRSTWPSRSRVCVTRDRGLPTASRTRSATSATEMSIPRREVDHLAGDRVDVGGDHRLDRLRVVVDVEPVAARVAIAVNRERLVTQSLRDEARNHLLRMLVGAVVVERPDDRDRQSVGDVVGIRQPVASRLRRRVRATGLERMLLVHRRVFRRPVHLARRDQDEALDRRLRGSRRAGSASPRRSSSRTPTHPRRSTSPRATRPRR